LLRNGWPFSGLGNRQKKARKFALSGVFEASKAVRFEGSVGVKFRFFNNPLASLRRKYHLFRKNRSAAGWRELRIPCSFK
jgi:hypothetical protein